MGYVDLLTQIPWWTGPKSGLDLHRSEHWPHFYSHLDKWLYVGIQYVIIMNEECSRGNNWYKQLLTHWLKDLTCGSWKIFKKIGYNFEIRSYPIIVNSSAKFVDAIIQKMNTLLNWNSTDGRPNTWWPLEDSCTVILSISPISLEGNAKCSIFLDTFMSVWRSHQTQFNVWIMENI
jgi:hypothetical protein